MHHLILENKHHNAVANQLIKVT